MAYLERASVWLGGGLGIIYTFVNGTLGQTFWILLGVMVLDLITGFMKGLANKKMSSSAMSVGILKKGGIIFAVIFAYLLDLLMNGGQSAFVVMMIWLAIANEGVSIIENLRHLGVNMPKAITDRMNDVIKEYEGKDDFEIKDDIEKEIEKEQKGDEKENDTKNKETSGDKEPQEKPKQA